jgi:two-component system, sensor histidine kinase and response regulator
MTHSDCGPNRDLSDHLNDTPTIPDTPPTDELAALRAIVEGTARHTGQEFFNSLVRHLAAAVGTRYAFVAVFAGGTRVRTLAFWFRDRITDNIEWDVIGTPCEDVVRGNLCHYPAGVSQRFPEDKRSVDWGIESYLGVPLRDAQGRHLGHLAVFDERPMPAEPRKLFIFRIFAARAAAELERLQYEERLRESEQRWRSLTEELRQVNARLDLAMRGSNIGIWEFDMPDGRIENSQQTFINVWESLGYEPREAPTDFASGFALAVHPDDQERLRREIQDFLVSSRREFETEYQVRHKGGSDRWRLARGVALRDPEGKLVRFIGSFVDITDLKRAEQALRESEERFRGTFENAAVGIAHRDLQCRFLRVNDKFCSIVGYSRGELLEMTFQDITHPQDLAAELGLHAPLLRGELPSYALEKRYVRKDGSLVWAQVFASLQRDAAGAPAYDIAIIHDITERKRLEEALRQTKEAAEAANRAKDEFLANVSHEIRTPMNAILGMTELALDTLLTEDQRQYLTTVKSAADALLGIINDVLDFAKIEAGRLELDPADFSLSSVLGATLRALAVRAHKKGLELICQQRPGVPDALIGDAGRLRQVLLNLVGNAIKFTERGEVVVLVENAAEPAPEGEVSLRFAVTDTGIGIPPEKQATIFQAFEQEDTSTTRKYGGTGLGLTIAARLAALMDGGITVDSAPGQGSTFAFTARFGLQPHPPETTAASPPVVLRGLPVLIVDDNATNRHILEEWLRAYSMEPTAAGDGATALAALWHGVAQGRPYPLALLDGRMPDVDGLDLAAKIRQQAELSATRLILLTSGDRHGDLTRARQLGISASLLKPLQQRELMETILRVVSGGVVSGELSESSSPTIQHLPLTTPLRILVAEDNDFNRDLLEHLLARLGLSAAMAINGREALALLEREPFDLLLLDVHMPELDGFQVVGAIRERERTAGGHLPVIALTARSRKEDRERCLRAGMDEYLAKPFNAADLWAAMNRVLKTRPPRKTPGLDLLDPPVLWAACGGDPAMLRKMCRSLQARVPEHLAAVRDALRDQDARRLREAAHKFYGMLSAFSTVAGDQAADLEDLAARGLLQEALPVVEQLDRCATELARLAGGLTIETLRKQAGPADGPNRTASP